MKVSVVIAVWNEQDNLRPVLAETLAAFARMPIVDEFEIVLVDDGSDDGSRDILAETLSPIVRVVLLSKHARKTAALHAGFAAARFPVVATMDGDGQDDPGELEPLLMKVGSGADFAIGNRATREDNLRKKLSSRIANGLRRALLGDPFPDIGCGLRVFRRECVASFAEWEGAHRFFPYFAWRAGFRTETAFIRHRPRLFGASKYGVFDRLVDGLTTLTRVLGSPPPRLGPLEPHSGRARSVALLAIVAFLLIGTILIGDWGWTRDGIASLERGRINTAILKSVFGTAPVPEIKGVMNHPALPSTVAYFTANALTAWFPQAQYPVLFNVPFFLISCCGLLFLFWLTRDLFDETVAAMAVLLLASYPRFIAYAHFLHKDVPLLVVAILVMWVFLSATRQRSLYWVALAGAACGLAVSVHLFGSLFLAIFPAALAAARRVPHADNEPQAGYFLSVGLFFSVAAAVIFFLNPILWIDLNAPRAAALHWSGSFWRYAERYGEKMYLAKDLPWHYTLVHFFSSLPLIYVAGLLGGVWAAFRRRLPLSVLIVVGCPLILPLLLATPQGLTRYDGVRHVLMALPVAVILSAFGIVEAVRACAGHRSRMALIAVAFLGVTIPLGEAVALHPFEEGYFNEVATLATGGFPARRLFAIDYDAPLLAATEWLNQHAEENASASFVGFGPSSMYRLRPDLRKRSAPPSRYVVQLRGDRPECQKAFSIVGAGSPIATIWVC